MKLFHNATNNDDINARINTCYNNIKSKITNRCGKIDFIEENGSIAFSGNAQNSELLLTLSIMKVEGKHYLYADLDDQISWQEWDFENQEDFENAITDYISLMINRTIKTVTEKKRHRYIKTSRYYLNNNKWFFIDEDVVDSWLIRLFITKDSTKEEVKSYQRM